jgi:Na+/H+ antiporter NhaD/arsenite permease-like protein
MLTFLASALAESSSSWHPHVAWVIPFGLMLAAIAVVPLVASHWWEHNRNKAIVSAALALPVVAYALAVDAPVVAHTAIEYASFIILLGSLFVVSGGILITGNLEATPFVNTMFLLVGAVIASFVGTTGASMLLIRPLLATNSERQLKVHTVVFFIFLVSNIGGCLTPLGDPPLFMGYLKGVPFVWTFNLWKEWAVAVAWLLGVYLLIDLRLHRRESRAALELDRRRGRPVQIAGGHNLLFLAGIVGAVAFLDAPVREGVMLALAAATWFTTSPALRAKNRFGFGPIVEVVVVFAGIFATMIPALLILGDRGSELGVVSPRQFFWATGVLSSFLDNTPTYLSFLALADGEIPYAPEILEPMLRFGAGGDAFAIPEQILVAISLGAVFMGANTYIGNGPNFMVRAIAVENGVRMPSFFGFLGWAVVFLIPLFVVMTFVFFAA